MSFTQLVRKARREADFTIKEKIYALQREISHLIYGLDSGMPCGSSFSALPSPTSAILGLSYGSIAIAPSWTTP